MPPDRSTRLTLLQSTEAKLHISLRLVLVNGLSSIHLLTRFLKILKVTKMQDQKKNSLKIFIEDVKGEYLSSDLEVCSYRPMFDLPVRSFWSLLLQSTRIIDNDGKVVLSNFDNKYWEATRPTAATRKFEWFEWRDSEKLLIDFFHAKEMLPKDEESQWNISFNLLADELSGSYFIVLYRPFDALIPP